MKIDFQTSRRKIAHLTERQYGHLTRRQLIALDVPSTTIDSWIRDGRLVRVHQGVYALGYRRVEPVARAMAAVLATGPGSVLSHDSALALWDLRRWPDEPEVISPRCVRRPGILAHRSSLLTARQTTTQLGVRTTRVARSLDDIRSRLTDRQLTRLANRARLDRLISAEEAEGLLGHSRNPTRSGLEDDFQRWLAHHGLPQPQINVNIDGREVDALYPDRGLIIELDAYATHNDPVTFQSDRDRDLIHLDIGYDTIRLTRERLTDANAARLRRRLATRGGSPV